MEKEPLSFRDNTCRIDAKVAGMDSKATGFIYVTSPYYKYDYVLTAKHAFQEEKEQPKISNISSIDIYTYKCAEQLNQTRIDIKNLEHNILFFDDLDLAILRLPKLHYSWLKRVFVKNLSEAKLECGLASDSFLDVHRKESTRLDYKLKDKDRGIVSLDDVRNIDNYKGISGSGIYQKDEPCLVSILTGSRIKDFEQNEVQLSVLDWDKVNKKLQAEGWNQLNRGKARYTTISENREVLDVRALSINNACLDMQKALERLQHDLADDWYFDPLHYIDLCSADFVLDYFSKEYHRTSYKPERMEVFYLPKKSYVLRKAMVGTFVDRLVYTATVSCLGPVIDRHLSRYVYSARFNYGKAGDGLIINGVDQWTKMNYLIDGWVTETTSGCLVKLDLLNYYDTINKHKLIRLLYEIASTENEKACVNLISTLLMGFSRPDEAHGIPQNCDASSLLATFYMSHVDELILAKTQHYCRFMDDMYFMAKDVYEARDFLQSIEKHLREIDLSLNAQKVYFFRLDKEADRKQITDQLALYDHDKEQIKYLIRSDINARRKNGVAKLAGELKKAMTANENKEQADKRQERALKFSLHALSSYRLELASYWDDFYDHLTALTEAQVDAPEQTPLICRMVANINKSRNIDGIKMEVEKLVLREHGSIYEWQAYHLWMLLAYLKYSTPQLIKRAAEEIETNDETKTIEVAAIFIYMVTVNPEYARILLHRLRDGQLHGNFQKRCALIAMRALDSQAIDAETRKHLRDPLKTCHPYLNRNKEKPLVFFHQITSHKLARNEAVLFPEYYSGL